MPPAATRASGRRWVTLRNALIVIQVALSVVILGITSMFLQALTASRAQRVGFAIEGVAMLDTSAKSIEEIATTIVHRAKLRRHAY